MGGIIINELAKYKIINRCLNDSKPKSGVKTLVHNVYFSLSGLRILFYKIWEQYWLIKYTNPKMLYFPPHINN